MIKVNTVVIAIIVIAVLAFFYFIFRQNRKDRKKLEQELNEREIPSNPHKEDQI